MTAFINSIGTANPQYKIRQEEVFNFMVKAHQLDEDEALKLKVLYRATGIKERYSTIADYQNTGDFHLYPDNALLEPFPSTRERSNWYKKEALSLSIEAVRNCTDEKIPLAEITHLITVSCTGMYAPGLDIEIVNECKISPDVERTAINFMGCYAAFNALKLANYICSSSKANVLIVCTELCTLHFQKEKNEDNFLANALFGDGSAAVLVQSEPAAVALEIEAFISNLLPNAKNEMAWEIGDYGFEMKLSAYVPEAIRFGVEPFIESIRKRIRNRKYDFYAIHPGGKKILSVVENALNISKEENSPSHKVLRDYGNMSSPTILFVMRQVLDELSLADNGRSMLSFGFGPGLTLESMITKVHII
jgi:alpha-pyrone synthase